MFWSKCGKIICDYTGAIIECNSSPCPFYAVFGFKYRILNPDTYQPIDDCSWNYEVKVYAVENGAIIWKDTCINAPTKKGSYVNKIFGYGCTSTEKCEYIYDVNVYNLTGGCDNYDAFLDLFFSKCDIQRNSSGSYDEDPFGDYYSSYPQSCFDEWLQYFIQQYAVSFVLNIKNMMQFWEIYGLYMEYKYKIWCECDGGYSSETGCPPGCEGDWFPWEGTGYGSLAWRRDKGEHPQVPYLSDYYYFFLGSPGEAATCETTVQTKAQLGNASNAAFSFISKKDEYTNDSSDIVYCNGGDNLCFEFEYYSSCDNDYWYEDRWVYQFIWKTLLLERLPNTPNDALGIKFLVEKTRTLTNKGNGENGIPTVTPDRVTKEDLEIILYFDEEYKDLPLSENITRPRYLTFANCETDRYDYITKFQFEPCPNGSWMEPPSWYYEYTVEIWNFKFKAIDYVKNK